MDHQEHHASKSMALSATLHCFTGCAVGEMTGLVVGTAIGLSALQTTGLAIGLAFLFGYLLSLLPLIKANLSFRSALKLVILADTLSILTMEVVDNAVMMVVPGAMEAGLLNSTFWLTMILAFSLAFIAAYPVNAYLLNRNQGHALTHEHHGHPSSTGFRRYLWVPSSQLLLGLLVGFFASGLTLSIFG